MSFNKNGKYIVPTDEDYEPDSDDEVLKNFLAIKSNSTMDLVEAQELKRTEIELLKIFDKKHQFSAKDICNIHELWLGDIYPFAGKYRTVNLGKGGFQFAISTRISALMTKLETEYLKKYTPCNFSNKDEIAFALGVIHIELILIHPFREGNGRTARLLSDLMVWQAKDTLLNYDGINQIINPQGFHNYILAIHAGHDGNYIPIQIIFRRLLDDSI